MAAATEAINTERRNFTIANTRTLTVKAAGDTIYKDTLVGIDSNGYAVPASSSGSLLFAGLAIATAEAGEEVECLFGEIVAKIALSGAAITDVQKLAYASDNQTATMSSNTCILGPVVDVETDYAWIKLTGGLD